MADVHDAVSEHLAKHLSEPDFVLHELIPEDPHIDVLVIKPTAKRPFYTLVTSGMSAQPMQLPEEMSADDATPYVELMLCLPPDWPIDDLDNDLWNWPIHWLRMIAKFPHVSGNFLYVGHSIPNGDPAEPFNPDTKLCCWFVHLPRTVDAESFCEMELDGNTVLFLALSPIYLSEMEFILDEDPEKAYELDQALIEAGETELIDLDRPPVK